MYVRSYISFLSPFSKNINNRPSEALLEAPAAWGSWHAALSRVKAVIDMAVRAKLGEGVASLFAPGIEILASSFDEQGVDQQQGSNNGGGG